MSAFGVGRLAAVAVAGVASVLLVVLTAGADTTGSRLGAYAAGAGAILLVVVALAARPNWIGPALALLAAGPLLALRGKSGFDASAALDAVLLVIAAEAALTAARPGVAVVDPEVAARRLVRTIAVVGGAALVSVFVTLAAVSVSTNTLSATLVGLVATVAVPLLALGVARATR